MNTEILPNDWSLWSATKPTVIKPLAGGLTNQNFLLSAGDKLLVLRWNSPISEALDLDRTTEVQVLQLADAAGLCAPLVYCDPACQYLVTEHLNGALWSVDGSGALTQLAQLLREIHQLPPVGAALDVEAKAAHYWQSIAQPAAGFFLADLQLIRPKVAEHISAAQLLSRGNCLCHNDLLKDNLVFADDRKLCAIDWEYAAMADPFYELAVIVDGHGFTAEQQEVFLSAYLDREVVFQDWQRLSHWRIIYAYLTVLWYTVQWSSGAMSGEVVEHTMSAQLQHLSVLIEQIEQTEQGVGTER